MPKPDDLTALIERMIEERTTLAVGPVEAGRRLCPENPLAPTTIARLVTAGHLARVPHTQRLCIPVAELERFVTSGMTEHLDGAA